MAAHITEEDLLDLIEGRLSPDRVGVVRRALTEDAELLAKVEGMCRDRGILRSDGRRVPALAPGVVDDAMETAEREMLIGPALRAREKSGKRKALLFAGSVAATVAVSSALVTVLVKYGVKVDRELPPLPLHVTSEPAKPPPDLLRPWLDEPVEVAVPKPDPQIERWTAEVEAASVPAVAEANTGEPAWLTDEAVKLAQSGRLKLIVPAGMVAEWTRTSAAVSPPEGPDVKTVVVRYRTADGEAGLRAALVEVSGRLGAMSPELIKTGDVGTDEQAARSQDVPMLAGDVLWWLRPATEWAPMTSVRVTVERAR
ncbi:MAG TPA: hypothetical protein VG797_03840 [Phycisphaerales bacterium]|nr:hypothetical protein [Phycisphaerales bacterium]